jgi:hypothetical protein
MKAFQLIKDSMNKSGPMPFVYLDKRAAEIWANENKEEWTQYKMKEVEVREFNFEEGAVNGKLVEIRRDSAEDAIRQKALKKLNAEERRALGL